MPRYTGRDLRDIRREAEEREREKSPVGKRQAPVAHVPVLPESNRKPPRDFQRKLDEFNRSTNERLFLYYHFKAVPERSSTVNAEGQYVVTGWSPRWELYRPVNTKMSREIFERIQPVIIQGHGPSTKLWTLLENKTSMKLVTPAGAEQITVTGDFREPDDRDIKWLRLGDLYRTDPGRLIKELVDKPNEEMTEAAEKEEADLIEGIADYYYHLDKPIFSLNPENLAKGQKADWRSQQGLS